MSEPLSTSGWTVALSTPVARLTSIAIKEDSSREHDDNAIHTWVDTIPVEVLPSATAAVTAE